MVEHVPEEHSVGGSIPSLGTSHSFQMTIFLCPFGAEFLFLKQLFFGIMFIHEMYYFYRDFYDKKRSFFSNFIVLFS